MTIARTVTDHVAEVVVDAPPVNALTVAGWFDLADAMTVLGSVGRDKQEEDIMTKAHWAAVGGAIFGAAVLLAAILFGWKYPLDSTRSLHRD